MNSRESLTVRTVSAMQRLADLERRGSALDGPRGGVLKTALRELETALEELRVASEQLNVMVDDMAEARAAAKRAETQFSEFRELLPVATLMTDRQGQIHQANAAAGELLNVAPRHLTGKPLSLYMVDRDRFFALLNSTRLTTEPLRAELAVRPRERKPRAVAVQLGQLGDANSLCWFLQENASASTAVT